MVIIWGLCCSVIFGMCAVAQLHLNGIETASNRAHQHSLSHFRKSWAVRFWHLILLILFIFVFVSFVSSFIHFCWFILTICMVMYVRFVFRWFFVVFVISCIDFRFSKKNIDEYGHTKNERFMDFLNECFIFDSAALYYTRYGWRCYIYMVYGGVLFFFFFLLRRFLLLSKYDNLPGSHNWKENFIVCIQRKVCCMCEAVDCVHFLKIISLSSR